jgi:hypothetical protein
VSSERTEALCEVVDTNVAVTGPDKHTHKASGMGRGGGGSAGLRLCGRTLAAYISSVCSSEWVAKHWTYEKSQWLRVRVRVRKELSECNDGTRSFHNFKCVVVGGDTRSVYARKRRGGSSYAGWLFIAASGGEH